MKIKFSISMLHVFFFCKSKTLQISYFSYLGCYFLSINRD